MLKNRIVKTITTNDFRPTSERVRKSLFDIIKISSETTCFVDLFAGSGIVGIEAISRGAKSVIFVESNKRLVDLLRENIRKLKIETSAIICLDDAFNAIQYACKNRKIDFVFCDPPYKSELYEKILESLGAWGQNIRMIMIEHFHKSALPERTESFTRFDRREWGDTAISFYAPF